MIYRRANRMIYRRPDSLTISRGKCNRQLRLVMIGRPAKDCAPTGAMPADLFHE